MPSALDILRQDQERSLRVAGSLALAKRDAAPAIVGKSGGSVPAYLFAQPDLGESSPTARLTRPYAQSPWIQRAINLKAGEISAVPVKFYEGDNEFASPDFDAFWAAPFIRHDRTRFSLGEGQLHLTGWLDLAGEYFVLRGDDWLVPFPEVSMAAGKLSPLVIARPDRMRPVYAGGEMLGWEFTDAMGKRWPLLPEQVEHVCLWNPYDEKRALAPVESVMLAAESDYLAGLYVRNLMRNNGDQGVYVIAKNGIPTDPQRDQITEQLSAKRRASLRGDYRPVFLTGDIAIEDAKAQVPDANLNAGRLLDRHTIFIGLGLPASMADVQASYSIGSDSDRARLISGTCQPLAKLINASFGRIGSRMVSRQLIAESDWDEHPVLQQIRRERFASAKDLWDRGISWKVINDLLDLGMRPFPGWDVAYMSFSVAPVDLSGTTLDRTPATDPSLADTTEETGSEDDPEMRRIKLALLARRRAKMKCVEAKADPFAEFVCACGGALIAKARDSKERKLWESYMQFRRPTVNAFQASFRRVLMKARQEVLRKIEAAPNQGKSIETKSAAADFLFNLADFVADFHAAMRNRQKDALATAGKQFFDEINFKDPFQLPQKEVLDFLAERKNKLRDVPQETFDRLKKSLEEGLNNGETQDELGGRVKDLFNDMADGEARRIALTETGAAYGAGRHLGMKQAGIQRKKWLTSGNDNVRAAHEAANGQTVGVDEPYVIVNEDGATDEIMFPGDSGGAPWNVINCHCISLAQADKGDE
jgi:hypothetical protein